MWLVAEARKEDLKLPLNATVRRIGSWWPSTVVGRSTPSIPRRGRRANAGLYRVVIVRMRWHRPDRRDDLQEHQVDQAETVVGLYKTECVKIDGPFRFADELELATVSWVLWFNENRLHSSID